MGSHTLAVQGTQYARDCRNLHSLVLASQAVLIGTQRASISILHYVSLSPQNVAFALLFL